MVYLGNTWFNVVGILSPVLLDSTLDSTVFISLPVAERLFQIAPNPSEIYVRANVNYVDQVANLLAPTRRPAELQRRRRVSRPSDALEARAAAKGQFTTLLLGLGAVALLVGAIGIANIMVISVLERRGEIGLRRALGATRRHISAPVPDRVGAAGGAGQRGRARRWAPRPPRSTRVAQNEPFVVPLYALVAAPLAGLDDRRAGGPVPGGQGGAAESDRGTAGVSAAAFPVTLANLKRRVSRGGFAARS